MCSPASAIALNHFGVPVDNMTYPITNPMRVPHPNPNITTLHVNLLSPSSSPSPSTSCCGSCGSPHVFCNGNPQSFGFPSNDVPNVLNCPPNGIRPLRWFCERFKNSRNFKPASDWGISPVSWFQDKSKDSISESVTPRFQFYDKRNFIYR